MKPLPKIRLCSAMCAFALSGMASFAHAAPPAASLLRAMNQADKNLSFTATETVVRPGAPTVRVKVQHADRKHRFDYLAPDVRRGDAVIDNGQTVWTYLAAEKTAFQTLSRPDRDFVMRPDLAASVTGAGNVDSRPAWIVQLTRNGNERRLWIDQKNGALLRRDMRRNGALVESSVLSDIRFGTVSASSFVWQAPAGTTSIKSSGTLYVSANAAKRRAMLKFPEWTPAGYSFESAIIDEKKGEAWLRFSGAKRFSIFQSRAEHATELQQVGEAWFVAKGGNRFVIVGLGEADARKLAEGL